MITQTSLQAYYHITPKINERQQLVLDFIRHHPDFNNREIAEHLRLPINRVTPRVKELKDFGLIIIRRIKPDFLTGLPTKTYEAKNYETN